MCRIDSGTRPKLQNVWQDWDKGACDQCMQRGEPNFKPPALASMAEEPARHGTTLFPGPPSAPPTPMQATAREAPKIEQPVVVPHQVAAQEEPIVTASLVRGGPMMQQSPPSWMSEPAPQKQSSMPQATTPMERSMSFQYEEGLGPPSFKLASLETAMTSQDGNSLSKDSAPFLIGHDHPRQPYQPQPYQPPWAQQQEWDEGAARREQEQQQQQQQQQQQATAAPAVSQQQQQQQQQERNAAIASYI